MVLGVPMYALKHFSSAEVLANLGRWSMASLPIPSPINVDNRVTSQFTVTTPQGVN